MSNPNHRKKDSVIICRCNNISKATIQQAIVDGCKTMNEIFDATTAGVGPCGGSCRRKLQPILDQYLSTGTFPEKVLEDKTGKNTMEGKDDTKIYRAEVVGRELIECELDSSGEYALRVIGSLATLELLRGLKAKKSNVAEWPLPAGNTEAEILVRELIHKVRGDWQFPIDDPELCHCRAVPAFKVDQAIVAGAHTVEKVRRMTSANTACGTCLPDVEKLLKFRLC